jgi:hypothetical protein
MVVTDEVEDESIPPRITVIINSADALITIIIHGLCVCTEGLHHGKVHQGLTSRYLVVVLVIVELDANK